MRNFAFIGFTKSKLLNHYPTYSFFTDKETTEQESQLLDLNRNYFQPDFILAHVIRRPSKRFCFKSFDKNKAVLDRRLLYLKKEIPEWCKKTNSGFSINRPFTFKSKIQKEISDDYDVRRFYDFYGSSLYFKIYRYFFKLIKR